MSAFEWRSSAAGDDFWICKGASKLNSRCCGWTRGEEPTIMRHNAGRDTASCWINPKWFPRPSERSPEGHKVKSTAPDPRESGSAEEPRQGRARGCCDDASRGDAWDLPVVRPCSPLSSGSRPDFSQRSIYNSADLLKVISEPSGPARWPGGRGPPERAARLENLNGHGATAETHKLKTNRKHCLHY